MLRITIYVQRFIKRVKDSTTVFPSYLTVPEYANAETYWIKTVQAQCFPSEVSALQESKPVDRTSRILTFDPFLDKNDFVRLGGRLDEASLPYDTRHPIIIPKGCQLVVLLIINAHETLLHAGVNATLNKLRGKFWIIQGRQQVKKVLAKCLKCKHMRGAPGREPFAPLPKDRMELVHPFDVVGIDFAGPLFITQGEVKNKAYVKLMSCSVTGGVHLGMVTSLNIEYCIRGLRRFISRRAVPSVIYSDNAKTFKRTYSDLETLHRNLSEHRIQEFSSNQRIEWKFIVERASWWGGFWERMVKTVKDALKITLGRALLDFEEMRTVLIEVESMVYSRPLTYVENEFDYVALTLSQFWLGHSTTTALPNMDKVPNRDVILTLWKHRQNLLEKFWKRWTTEYLQQLRSAHFRQPLGSRPLHVGEVVLVYDDNAPRLLWRLARITNIFIGRDGKARSCEIMFPSGAVTRRPIQRLYPLEVAPAEDEKNNEVVATVDETRTQAVSAVNGERARSEVENER